MDDFQFCDVEHQLEILDRNSTTFRSEHKFLLQAISPSRFFVREYGWTGSGVEKEPVPEVISDIDDWGFAKHRIHGPLLSEGRSRVLIVDLGRTINKDEYETVVFKHRMKDLGKTFEPVFWVKAKRRIRDRLKLRLILPEWGGLRMMYHCSTHDTGKVLKSAELAPIAEQNGRLTFEMEIINPSEKNFEHRLAWTHNEL